MKGLAGRVSLKKVSWDHVKEYVDLAWINLVVQKRNLVEFCKVVYKYYTNLNFLKIDASLLVLYIYNNPFSISKRFLMKKGEVDIHTYGETPLTTIDKIASEINIQKKDVVYELGSGRGRCCFWLHSFIGCKVVGVEYIPEFVERSKQIRKEWKLSQIEFRNDDMLKADLSDATVIYLYGTCYPDEFIKQLINKLKKLPSGTKIVTVSYPLTDYITDQSFKILKHFPAEFTWGTADVYYQVRA